MTDIIDELFLMVNLAPPETGLPMVIWAGPSYGAPHDVRIKVMQTHGMSMDPHNLAVVGVRPQPHLVAGQLSTADLRAVSDWIRLNEAALIGYWNGTLLTSQFIQQLQPLLPPIPP
jgi:hypothetical protein